MKVELIFASLLAVSAAKKCVVKDLDPSSNDVAIQSDDETKGVPDAVIDTPIDSDNENDGVPDAVPDTPADSDNEDNGVPDAVPDTPVESDEEENLVETDAVETDAVETDLPDLEEEEDSSIESEEEGEEETTFKKLPADFKWGAATAAYQVEGAWNEGGRGESVWDHFTHLYPKNVETGDESNPNSTNGNVACDSYHKFEEDIKMLKIMNAKYYRFSISWSRLFPDGEARKVDGKWNVNEVGTEYYNMLIDTLLLNDITPFVTLYHWDLPYALHEKYGGWLDYRSQDDFAAYAEYCFEAFGDRVKNWITINEPWVNCVSGYRLGPGKAPYRCTGEAPRKLQNDTSLDVEGGCSYEIGPSQYSKDSEVLPANRPPQRLEDVWCSHNILIAHAKAVNVYREKFQEEQKGLIGITVDGEAQIPWEEPDMSEEELENNKKYANLAAEFRIGWYSDPPMVGDYPASVKERMGKDLPEFTAEEKALLKGSSSDFLGWNTYTSHWAAQVKNEDGTYVQPPTPEEASFETSKQDMWDDNCRGRGEGWSCIPPTLGSQAGSSWNTKYGPTIRVGLNWFADRYKGLIKNGIVITENGCAQPNAKVNRPSDYVTEEYFQSIGKPEYADLYTKDIIEDESKPEDNILEDKYRIDWYAQYLENLRLAYAEDGVDVRGYMAWSLVDNFEWENGYETRFGMTYIDFYNDKNLERKPKQSLYYLGQWYLDNVEQE